MDQNHSLLDPWYKSETPHDAVFATLDAIKNSQTLRSSNNLRYARLYGNADIVGLSPAAYFQTGAAGSPTLGPARLTWNVVKSMVDTVTSKIAKNKPRPVFLTNAGDPSLQKQAKLLSRWVLGVFDETRAYEKGVIAFRNCGIFGSGYLKVYKKEGRIAVEQVISEEIIVDQVEALYGTPRNIYQRRNVDRDVLMTAFGKDEASRAAITSAPNAALSAGASSSQATADIVEVVEAWHLASSRKAKDGKHTICIKNACLFEETYTRTTFPFVSIAWTPPIVGWYGIGLAEELIGIQLEINKLLRQIQLSHHLLSTPKIFIDSSSDVVSAHMNNEIGAIIKFRGTMPQIHSFQTVHPEIYQHLDRLYSRAYEIAGVSALSAQAKKPAGLDSGKALREFSDIESERFAITQQRWEQLFVDLAEHCVELARELTDEGKSSFEVNSPNKRAMDQIDFKDVCLDESSYVLQVYPTNFLPATPAGRLQSVQELVASGFIPQEMGRALLDFPDLEGAMDLLNASYEDAMLYIEKILVDGEPQTPDPFGNLKQYEMLSQAAYLKAKNDGVPEERLELLRRFTLAAVQMQGQAQAAAMPPPTPGIPTAAAPPGAPPEGNVPLMPGVVPGA